jgi:hypothetical protein
VVDFVPFKDQITLMIIQHQLENVAFPVSSQTSSHWLVCLALSKLSALGLIASSDTQYHVLQFGQLLQFAEPNSKCMKPHDDDFSSWQFQPS